MTPITGLESTKRALQESRWRHRWVPTVILAGVVVVLGVSYWLEPNPNGLGTHQQLGMPACGFVAFARIPCITCGMTTAFSHAAHGRIIAAFVTQPAGAMLAVLTAAMGIISAYALFWGTNLGPVFRRLWTPKAIWLGGLVALLSWVYKIMAFRGVF